MCGSIAVVVVKVAMREVLTTGTNIRRSVEYEMGKTTTAPGIATYAQTQYTLHLPHTWLPTYTLKTRRHTHV